MQYTIHQSLKPNATLTDTLAANECVITLIHTKRDAIHRLQIMSKIHFGFRFIAKRIEDGVIVASGFKGRCSHYHD